MTRRWMAASALALIAIEAGTALAQGPPTQGHVVPGAQAKTDGKRPARRKPKRKASVGVIVPYPFPPALIIRQTPEAHDEVRDLLSLLRHH